MADKADDSLYPIAVLIDELKNEDIQVSYESTFNHVKSTIPEYFIYFYLTATFELDQETVNNCFGFGRGKNTN